MVDCLIRSTEEGIAARMIQVAAGAVHYNRYISVVVIAVVVVVVAAAAAAAAAVDVDVDVIVETAAAVESGHCDDTEAAGAADSLVLEQPSESDDEGVEMVGLQ